MKNIKKNGMSENEKMVIQWAFNFTHSIVAGDYRLPNPMNYTMNNLQDAVFGLAQERGISIKEGCSKEYLGYHDGYWARVEESLKKRTSEEHVP